MATERERIEAIKEELRLKAIAERELAEEKQIAEFNTRRQDPRWQALEKILRTDKLFKPMEYEFIFEKYSIEFVFKLNLPNIKLGANASRRFEYPKGEIGKEELKKEFSDYLKSINLRNGTSGGWGLFKGWF